MDAINGEFFIFLVGLLAIGSSLIHYTAYAKDKAKIVIRCNKKY